ncbi:hypothetical protein LTR85_005701 [Meristemomyces frigidus]|nr:hypothetical protein LTR85_005701 [Meristemomyces frigidus]
MATSPAYQQALRSFAADQKLMHAVKVIGSFDCPAHPSESFCYCTQALPKSPAAERHMKQQFLMPWEVTITHEDIAFLYIGDVASATLFQSRKGKTPEEYARSFRKNHAIARLYGSTGSEEDLVKAMLAFWADRAQ